MKYILMASDTTCVDNLSTCCNDYGIAYYLFIIKKVLDIIHFVVPFILILMATIDFVKMTINPDDPQKKKYRALLNKFLAAVFVFNIPFTVNLLFNLIENFNVEISSCWNAAEEIVNIMDDTDSYDSDTKESNNNTAYQSGTNYIDANDSSFEKEKNT